MKTLDRYILREMIVPFLIGTLSVVLMFQANTLIYQLKTFSIQNVPTLAIAQWILYQTPSFLVQTLPVGMALAASLAITRLTRESELTAMRSAGASIMRVVMSVMAFGLVVSIGNYLLAEKVMPPAAKRFRDIAIKIGTVGGIPDFYSNALIKLQNYTVSIGSVVREPDGSIRLSGITMFERPRPGEVTIIDAENGTYRDGIWTFKDSIVWRFVGSDVLTAQPKDTIINQKVVIQDLFMTPTPEEMTLPQLRAAIDSARRTGSNTRMMEIAYNDRFSIPASCLVFALVAPVLAIRFARGGGFVGVLLSIILVFAYYNAYIISREIIGRNGWLDPWLASWLPNILFVILGVVALRRLE